MMDLGKDVKSVLVVRALPGLGDMMCVIPAIRALRKAVPRARISLLGLPWASSFAARFPHYFNEFIGIPGFPGLHDCTAEEAAATEAVLCGVRERHFDLALQLHGSGEVSNLLLSKCGAKVTCGFFPSSGQPGSIDIAFPYPDHLPEIHRNLELINSLGGSPAGDTLEFPLDEGDRAELQSFLGNQPLQARTYACLHPGSSTATRRWLPERFAEVGDALASHGLQVVLTGSGREWDLNEYVARLMNAPSRNMAGSMSAGALAALIADARLLVCNDTGVSHLAAALNIPSVVVFTAGDPRRWAPVNSRRHRAVYTGAECRPCMHAECPIGHPCARQVSPGAVLRQVNQLLGRDYQPGGPFPTNLQNIALVCSGVPVDSPLLGPAISALESALSDSRLSLLSFSGSVEQLRGAGYEAAIILGGPGESPYDAAYACYLAGIPIRAGQSREFGGALLTHQVRPLPSTVSADRQLVYFVRSLLRDSGKQDVAGELVGLASGMEAR